MNDDIFLTLEPVFFLHYYYTLNIYLHKERKTSPKPKNKKQTKQNNLDKTHNDDKNGQKMTTNTDKYFLQQRWFR